MMKSFSYFTMSEHFENFSLILCEVNGLAINYTSFYLTECVHVYK